MYETRAYGGVLVKAFGLFGTLLARRGSSIEDMKLEMLDLKTCLTGAWLSKLLKYSELQVGQEAVFLLSDLRALLFVIY